MVPAWYSEEADKETERGYESTCSKKRDTGGRASVTPVFAFGVGMAVRKAAATGDGAAVRKKPVKRCAAVSKAVRSRDVDRLTDVEDCSRYVRESVAKELPAICRKLLQKARAGDATALKTLWQMGGMAKAGAEGGAKAGESDGGVAFAKAALKRFGG